MEGIVIMTKTMEVVFDGSVFRPSGPVHLEVGKKYTITVKSLLKDTGVEQDPAFDISSLAVTTGKPDLASEHDHYLYGLHERRN
jgi:predicted DNA-binding antitoxin AbrB/MazE fold protein